MFELYRNELIDLLPPRVSRRCLPRDAPAKLNVRVDKLGAVEIEHLTEEVCGDAAELLHLLDRGKRQRSVAATAMNSESSRSHLMITLKISSTNKETGDQLQGKILMCDLAGSER